MTSNWNATDGISKKKKEVEKIIICHVITVNYMKCTI